LSPCCDHHHCPLALLPLPAGFFRPPKKSTSAIGSPPLGSKTDPVAPQHNSECHLADARAVDAPEFACRELASASEEASTHSQFAIKGLPTSWQLPRSTCAEPAGGRSPPNSRILTFEQSLTHRIPQGARGLFAASRTLDVDGSSVCSRWPTARWSVGLPATARTRAARRQRPSLRRGRVASGPLHSPVRAWPAFPLDGARLMQRSFLSEYPLLYNPVENAWSRPHLCGTRPVDRQPKPQNNALGPCHNEYGKRKAPKHPSEPL
jgi:hypothetical protein